MRPYGRIFSLYKLIPVEYHFAYIVRLVPAVVARRIRKVGKHRQLKIVFSSPLFLFSSFFKTVILRRHRSTQALFREMPLSAVKQFIRFILFLFNTVIAKNYREKRLKLSAQVHVLCINLNYKLTLVVYVTRVQL